MSEFDPPRTHRDRMRADGVRTVISAWEQERSLRAHVSAVQVVHGEGERLDEAREQLARFHDIGGIARPTGRVILESTPLYQQEFDSLYDK